MWPMLLDTPKDECKRILRRLELEAYGCLVSALRGQGELDKSKRQLLQDTATALHISTERHRAEIRRAVNDEKLATVAERLAGPNTNMEWAIEGRRLVPLMSRLPPQTAFTALANNIAKLTAAENAKLPPPQNTAQSPEIAEVEEPSAPESSRTAQNQQTVTPATTSSSSQQQMLVKMDESESRKRRRSSLEIPGQPISPSLPPPKIAAVGQPLGQPGALLPVSRTLNIPTNLTPVKISRTSTTVRPTSAVSAATTQKVIIMSSAPCSTSSTASPSLLQRSLSVPMVKTVTTMAPISTTGIIASTSSGLLTRGPAPQVSSFVSQSSTPRIRPKISTPAAMMPRGRAGSIVIPLTPNTPPSTSGLHLKPVTSATSKPTLHIKQDGSGMKIIAAAPKLMPKPPTVVVTTAGATRLVTLTATPRVSTFTSMAGSSSVTTPSTPQPIPAPSTTSKPLSHLGVAASSTPGKPNVIVVKKGTTYTTSQGVTLAQSGRELFSKVLLRTPQSASVNIGQKSSSPQTASGLAQALNIQGGTRQGNVIVVDLSQEQLKGNTVLSELLQASGFLTTGNMTPTATSTPADKRPSNLLDETLDEQQQSPSSSTDTGSSLELNQSGGMSSLGSSMETSQSGNVSFEETIHMLTPSRVTSRVASGHQTLSNFSTVPTSSRVSAKHVTTVPHVPATYRLVNLEDKSVEVNSPDMQKIEKEMMSLGEGADSDPEIILEHLVTSTVKPVKKLAEVVQSSSSSEPKPKVTEERGVSILEQSLTRDFQRVVKEACLEDKPEIIETTSQETQAPDVIGELDPQTGIFCLNSDTQDESLSSVGPSRSVDIYSAAISSANITFDSNSETEPDISEVTAPLHATLGTDSSEEEISLVYNEPDELVDQKTSSQFAEEILVSTEIETATCEQTTNSTCTDKEMDELLNNLQDDIPLEDLEENAGIASNKEEGETKPDESSAKMEVSAELDSVEIKPAEVEQDTKEENK